MAGLGAGTVPNTRDDQMIDKPNMKAVITELRRELEMRQRLYPLWARQGRMTAEQKDHRVACLIEAIADLETRHAPAKAQGSLGL